MARRFAPALAIALIASTLSALPAAAQSQPMPPPAGDGNQGAPAPMPPGAVPAPAAAVMTKIDPQEALQILQDAGYRAQITHTEPRSVDLQTRMSGLIVYLTLLGCTDGRQCTSIQLRMTADLAFFGMNNDSRQDLDAAVIGTNRWGDFRRYTTSYVFYNRSRSQYYVALNTDLGLFGGISREAISYTVRNYADLAGEFVAFMRNPANRQLQGPAGGGQ